MTTKLAIVPLLFAGLVACRSEEPKAPDVELTMSTVPGFPDLGRGSARFIRIDLGPDTFAECQRLSPKFPFDSAQTYAQDRMQLAAFAACLNLPEVRDRTVLLVGRADPRGTDAYNDRLGMRRANAIKQLLIENGVSESRIEITSEGEKDARGDTEQSSAGYDRRVDVVVKGGAHVP